MFSQTVEYALRAMVHLATHVDIPQTNEMISQATKVPQAYLAKVLRELSRNGLVKSQRGVGGGVLLVSPISKITILDVVNAVEPIRRIKSCPLEIGAHGTRLCALHSRVDKAIAAFEDAFRSTTLADLLAEPNPSMPLCDAKKKAKIELGIRKV